MDTIKVVICLLVGACLILLCPVASFAQGHRHHERGEILVINDAHRDISIDVRDEDGRSVGGPWNISRHARTYLADANSVKIKVGGNYQISSGEGLARISDVGQWHDGYWTVRYRR